MGILLGALAAAASASLVPSGGVLMPIIGATESRERRRRLAQMQVAVREHHNAHICRAHCRGR